MKVTNVEIREIIPPPTVLDAMTRQMSAERTRRAVVTEADGAKQAAITVAEGNKQSAILNAEGDRQAAILRAEGFSLALTKIYEAAQGPGREHDEPAVPGDAEADRRVALDEVRDPDGASSLLSGIAGLAGRSFGDGDGSRREGASSS